MILRVVYKFCSNKNRMISLLPGLLIFFYTSVLIVLEMAYRRISLCIFWYVASSLFSFVDINLSFVRGDVVSKILFTKTNIAAAVMASILLIILLWLFSRHLFKTHNSKDFCNYFTSFFRHYFS